MQTQTTFEMHEPAVIIATLWFVVLNPVFWFINCHDWVADELGDPGQARRCR